MTTLILKHLFPRGLPQPVDDAEHIGDLVVDVLLHFVVPIAWKPEGTDDPELAKLAREL